MKAAVIKPLHCPAIWADGDHIYLELPSLFEGGTPHTIKVINDISGMAKILTVIRNRARETRTSTLGMRGSPTQAMVDQYRVTKNLAVKAERTKRLPRNQEKIKFSLDQRQGADKILKRLGMI